MEDDLRTLSIIYEYRGHMNEYICVCVCVCVCKCVSVCMYVCEHACVPVHSILEGGRELPLN